MLTDRAWWILPYLSFVCSSHEVSLLCSCDGSFLSLSLLFFAHSIATGFPLQCWLGGHKMPKFCLSSCVLIPQSILKIALMTATICVYGYLLLEAELCYYVLSGFNGCYESPNVILMFLSCMQVGIFPL